jgi:glycosyltransferase involved in cell wall biosynthesis
MRPKLSLIIAVYNKPDFLEKILTSISNQTFNDFEIVIADDGSRECIISVIDQYRKLLKFPIKHVWHPDDGFRKTIIANKAVAAANGDYLVFIDGDCILHHRFLERHYRHKKINVALAGRRVFLDKKISEKISLQDIKTKKIQKVSYWWRSCSGREKKHGFYIPFSYHIEELFHKKYWILGSNFSVHKADFLSVNGYDESIIGRGVEDHNLNARFELKGIVIKKITQEALQYHLFHNSDPVPHTNAAYERFCNPVSAWAVQGYSRTL